MAPVGGSHRPASTIYEQLPLSDLDICRAELCFSGLKKTIFSRKVLLGGLSASAADLVAASQSVNSRTSRSHSNILAASLRTWPVICPVMALPFSMPQITKGCCSVVDCKLPLPAFSLADSVFPACLSPAPLSDGVQRSLRWVPL